MMIWPELSTIKHRWQFDKEDYEGFVFSQGVILCNLQEKEDIRVSWIFLDKQSMVNVFCNGKMLTNINDAKHDLILNYNSGTASVTKKEDLKNIGTV